VKNKNGIFRKSFTGLFLILAVTSFISLGGCNKEGELITSSVAEETVEAEASSTKNSAASISTASDAFAYLTQIANGITINTSGCPIVTATSTGGTTWIITVDYGTTPCITVSDSIRRTGKYIISGYVSPAKDSVYGSLSFPSDSPLKIYRVKGNSSDTNYVMVQNTNSSLFSFAAGKRIDTSNFRGGITVNNIFTTNSGIAKTINLVLTFNANLGVLNVFSDDSFYIKGAGAIFDNRYGVQFAYVIADSLNIRTDCRYPLRGKVGLTAQTGGTQNLTYVDFYPGSGACDGVVTILRGSFSKNVNLDSQEN